jgi:hypothetical protein
MHLLGVAIMKTSTWTGANLAPSLGLIVGPALWAANTQLGQVLPELSCSSGVPFAALASLAAALATASAAYISWCSVGSRMNSGPARVPAYPCSTVFVGRLGGLNSAIFAFALVLQAMPALVFTGCER